VGEGDELSRLYGVLRLHRAGVWETILESGSLGEQQLQSPPGSPAQRRRLCRWQGARGTESRVNTSSSLGRTVTGCGRLEVRSVSGSQG